MLRFVILAVLMGPMLAGCDLLQPLKVLIAGREVKPLEHQYLYLGSFMRSSKPCHLISKQALLFAPLNPDGLRYRYARTECFYYVAVNTQNAQLCDRLVDVPGWLDRWHTSLPEHCRGVVARGNIKYGDSLDLSVILHAMDYSEEEIEQRLATPRETPFTEEFFYRIEQMPHFGSAADMREMKAMTWVPPPPPMPMPCFPSEDAESGGEREPAWLCLPIPGAAPPGIGE